MSPYLAHGAGSNDPADSVNDDGRTGRANSDDSYTEDGATCEADSMGSTGKRFTAQGIHASIDYSDEPDQSDDNSDGDSDASYDAHFWTEEEYIEATKAIQKICKDSKNVSQFLRSGGSGYKLSVSSIRE